MAEHKLEHKSALRTETRSTKQNTRNDLFPRLLIGFVIVSVTVISVVTSIITGDWANMLPAVALTVLIAGVLAISWYDYRRQQQSKPSALQRALRNYDFDDEEDVTDNA